MDRPDTILIYAINRTDAWWKHVGENLGFARNVVVTDIRGKGDCDVIDDFYDAYRRQRTQPNAPMAVLSAEEVDDVIARCRLLRWLPTRQARGMVVAMEHAFTRVLDRVDPALVLSFPIDRYVSDVLERLARRRNIPYVELTASLISGMSMLMYRGQLVKTAAAPSPDMVREQVQTIAKPDFTPSYVQTAVRYTSSRWWKTFIYFRIRGLGFKLISWFKRDALNLHYLDAQAFLGHKPRLADRRIVDMVDWQWRDKIDAFPKHKRVFFGLQLFPEASIDYWLANRELIDYEDLLIDAATAFSRAGFQILVKDHPSQFGFRQCALLDRLLALPNVVLLPYEVSGNEAISLVGSNFTLTGTLGLQAALLGLVSVASPTYYTTPGDFLTFNSRAAIPDLPALVQATPPATALEQRQERILTHLLQGSFEGDFFSFRGFSSDAPHPGAKTLAEELGRQLRAVLNRSRQALHA
ncbi:MAG: hypothetical protein KDH93_05520 [Rhodoferax sp.]|nr:hypothetical protein [Rhodoferax sp.]MCB2004456.1 hypothetical protein [Rhodoferax sp.]MCB2027358.1 hypothetical protein [Rhodoferax sp.]MCP5263838.1 hypothetical protein [Rhodoferax sp.]